MESYKNYLKEVLITEKSLKKRIIELGAEISEDYRDSQDLLLICVLRGAFIFLSDLSRELTVPHAMDFMAISSYGTGNRNSTGVVRINMDLTTNINSKDVLIVEDIIDSGNTLSYVMDLLSTRRPKSLHVCALLDKHERREVDIPIRYTGFQIPKRLSSGQRSMRWLGVAILLQSR